MNMVRISRYTIVQSKLAGLRSTESAARADSVIFSDLLSEGRNLIACGTHHGQGSALPVGGRGPCQRLNTALPSPRPVPAKRGLYEAAAANTIVDELLGRKL